MMIRSSQLFRTISQRGLIPIRRHRSLTTSGGSPQVTQPAPPLIQNELNSAERIALPSWCGGNVDVVLHQSFESMVPTDIISLPGEIFNAPIRPDLIHRVVTWQLAKRRAGTAKAKNRSEVAGSGRKIRPQKGTGRSRHGARTSPIFRGGGRVFGPVPRSFYYPLPANVRRNALRSMLSSKLVNGQLWVVNDATISDSRTKTVIHCMDKYGWGSALIIDDIEDGRSGVSTSLHRASHSVKSVLAMNALGLNVYDALVFKNLVLTTAAIDHLVKRFAKYDWLF